MPFVPIEKMFTIHCKPKAVNNSVFSGVTGSGGLRGGQRQNP